MNHSSPTQDLSWKPKDCTAGNIVQLALLMFAASVLISGSPARAANLLVNPGFETPPSGHNSPPNPPATGWTRFAPPTAQPFGNYWVENSPAPHSGTFYFKEWGAVYNAAVSNVAGIYQDFSCSPGSVYQASGWLFTRGSDVLGADCYLWLEVSFLGSSTNLLALYKSASFNAAVGTDTWFQYGVTNACDPSQPVSVGDPYFNTYAITGSVSQLVAPLGATTVRYRFAYLQAGNQGGSAGLDDAVLNQLSGPVAPVISNLFPQNMIFVNPSDGLSFNVSSPSGFTINSSEIHLSLNGVDVSGSLGISGTASSKNVTYSGLQSNTVYNASITVTDSFNLTVSASNYFETTWVGIQPVVYLWEAEDFDYTNGMYLNQPVLCNVAGNPNCYFDKVGVESVDEHKTGVPQVHVYRADDAVASVPSGDYARKDHFVANVLDYRVDPFNGGEWLNYTRDWSNGTYWVVGRLSTDISLSGTLTLSKVNPDTSTTDLGTFSINNGRGWSAFDNIYLKDTNGNNALVTLSGKQTLRVTSGGNLLPNFFMLVTAQADLPLLSNVYPSGTHPFEYTNAFSFTVTTLGATFPANSIRLTLDGYDVTANLVISGSASAKNVVSPNLMPNAVHVAVISVTNSLGHGIRVTNRFDTFNQTNYMVEAEDFDYDSGQYVAVWEPDAYFGFGAVSNIDYRHIPLDGESYHYRTEGVPEDTSHDYLRQSFIDFGAIDYSLTYFGDADWANFTRVYPAGNFYVYGRMSGGTPFSMYLDQVVSGAGTTNQVTRRLGQWAATGSDYLTYLWVPLTDNGAAAPVVVKLNGLSTLRITTTGNCNPNYFMLVPVSGIPLTVARSGGNLVLSFPTQAGANYRVFYRTDLASGNWALLTSVLGDSTVKSVSDPVVAGNRFYKVTAP